MDSSSGGGGGPPPPPPRRRKEAPAGQARQSATATVLIGLPSNGLHTQRIIARRNALRSRGQQAEGPIADELLKLHRSYLNPIRALQDAALLRGAAHITGGGITRQHAAQSTQRTWRKYRRRLLPVLPDFRIAAADRRPSKTATGAGPFNSASE